MISSIIIVISMILDGILTNYLPYMTSDLSLFTPLLTITSLVVIYPLFYKEKKKYLITLFILGIVYDLFYTNLLFLDGLIFLCLGFMVMKIYQLFGSGYIKVIITILLVIIVYELLNVSIFIIFNLVPVTLSKIIYKISHSILLNLIYGEFIYVLLGLVPKKYSKIN